jgi:serine/threonine-protein kinase
LLIFFKHKISCKKEKEKEEIVSSELPRKILGNYELIDVIAAGGMGSVFRAVQLSLRRLVAVKLLHGRLAGHPDFINRFEREAVTLGSLSNENIVGVIDFGLGGDPSNLEYFIVMEYVDGVPLSNLVMSMGGLSENIALTIFENAVRGLAYAHRKGVVHRDINPANIMLSRDGIIKVTDFGLCTSDIDKETGLTQVGVVMGTPRYMSPEQASGFEMDERTDIYSMGLVLFELLTGDFAVLGSKQADVIYDVIHGDNVNLSRLPRGINSKLEKILEKTLEKRPDKRYSSCAEILTDIRKLRLKTGKLEKPALLTTAFIKRSS